MFTAVPDVSDSIIHAHSPFTARMQLPSLLCASYKLIAHDFKSGTDIIVRIRRVVVVRIAIVVHIAEVSSRRYQAAPCLSFLLLLSDCLQPFNRFSSRFKASSKSSVNFMLTLIISFI